LSTDKADIRAKPPRDFVATAAAIGAVAAGVALFEVALIPGLVIGGAAVLAPRYVPRYLPRLRRRLQPLVNAAARPHAKPARPSPGRPDGKAVAAAPARFAIGQALAKTITYQAIVTTMDFGVNYVVIGELATAAGLSAFGLVVRPVFYLIHETAWNYVGSSVERKEGAWGTAVDLSALLRLRPGAKAASAGQGGFMINQALAKTITFRTLATVMDFTANYVVVRDVATAAALSASGFVLGPFVYLGHEMAWDRYGSTKEPARERTLALPAPAKLLPSGFGPTPT
jgi:uncharacterized membrane protein